MILPFLSLPFPTKRLICHLFKKKVNKRDGMFFSNSYLPLTAKPGCCWDPSFAMGLQRCSPWDCDHSSMAKEELQPWIFSSLLISHSSCHAKQVRSTWSFVWPESAGGREKLHREAALSCQIQGKRAELLWVPSLNTEIFQDCLGMCNEDGLCVWYLWGSFILAAVVVFRCTLTKLSSATYLPHL